MTPRASIAVARAPSRTVDAELGELLGGLRRELLAERGHHALAGVEQDHPRLGGVDAPELALQVVRR